MKNNKFLCLTLCGLIALSSYSQKRKPPPPKKDDDAIKYSILMDNPGFGFFGVNGDLLNVNFNNYNFPIGTGLGMQFLSNNLYLETEWNFQTSGLNLDIGGYNPACFSVYNDGPSRNLELKAAYMFYGDDSETKLRIVVKSTASGNVRTNYYIEVPGTERKFMGAELSINKGLTFYATEKAEMMGTRDGVVTPMKDLGGTSTMYDFLILNLGVTGGTSHYLKANVEGFGEKSTMDYSRWYARLSFLLKKELDDVLYPVPGTWSGGDPQLNGASYYRYELTSNTKFSGIGLNAGYTFFPGDKFGVGGIVELGYFPGPKSGFLDGVYFRIDGSLSFAKLFGVD